jgi:hypothetical protein
MSNKIEKMTEEDLELIALEAESERRDEKMIIENNGILSSSLEKTKDNNNFFYRLFDLDNDELDAMEDMIDDGFCSPNVFFNYNGKGIRTTNCKHLARIHKDSGKDVQKVKIKKEEK